MAKDKTTLVVAQQTLLLTGLTKRLALLPQKFHAVTSPAKLVVSLTLSTLVISLVSSLMLS